jgi:hypothetical protein
MRHARKEITEEEAFKLFAAFHDRRHTPFHNHLLELGHNVGRERLRRWMNEGNWIERAEGVRVLPGHKAPATFKAIEARVRENAQNVQSITDAIGHMADAVSGMVQKAAKSIAEQEPENLSEAMQLMRCAVDLAKATAEIQNLIAPVVPASAGPLHVNDAYPPMIEGTAVRNPAAATVTEALAAFRAGIAN